MSEDKIIYKVFKDEKVVHATFSKKEAHTLAVDEDAVVLTEVVDVAARREEAARKLDLVSRLVLGIDEYGNPIKPPITYRGEV